MKIDNQKNTYKIWISRLVTAIVFTLLIVIMIFIPWVSDPDFWLTEYHVIILLALIYLGISFFNAGKMPYFISYNDHGEMIVLRYYSLSLFNSKKNSIEIPKAQFVKYELIPFFFGRHNKLVLFQNFRSKVVPYPPISLSALDEDDRDRILASLQKYMAS